MEDDLKVVTDRAPSEKEMEDLLFAWRVVKFVKSNGIALAKDKQTVGIGMDRLTVYGLQKQAIDHAAELMR